jgi:hypothetical protein
MGKEEQHWICVFMHGWFSAKLGWKISDGPTPAVSKTCVAAVISRDITNRNQDQPLLLFHMDPTNTIVWARKSFIGSVVSCGVDFQQNLGGKSHCTSFDARVSVTWRQN